MYKLSEIDQERVAEEPEFGMGYHLARVQNSGPPDVLVILHCEYAIRLEEILEVQDQIPDEPFEPFEDEREADVEPVLEWWFGEAEALRLDLYQIDFYDVNTPFEYSSGEVQRYRPRELVVPRIPFSPIPRLQQRTRPFDGFVRVSASPDDPKITDGGAVLPGTYASTTKDFKEVPSGFSAVGRYALPKPVSARYAYVIVPSRDAKARVVGGTVRPAFNQSGGGVEVQFPDGLPPGSAHPEPYLIPTI